MVYEVACLEARLCLSVGAQMSGVGVKISIMSKMRRADDKRNVIILKLNINRKKNHQEW